MRKTLALALLVGYGVVSVGPSVPAAQAETLSFASGIESNGDVKTCFKWVETNGSVGLIRDLANECTRHYFVPLYWRTFLGAGASRTITMTYRRASSAATADCNVAVYDAAGVVVTMAPFNLTVTGTNYSTASATVTGVVSGGTSFVVCTLYPTAGMFFLKVNWNP